MGKKSLAFPSLLWTCVGPAHCSAKGSTRRAPTSLRLYSHKLHFPGQDTALQCPVSSGPVGLLLVQRCGCTLGTRTRGARHVHSAKAFEEAAPVVFVTSLQRAPPITGEGRAKWQEGAEGGAPALTGGSSGCVHGGLGTPRATLLPECLVQLECGPRLPLCVVRAGPRWRSRSGRLTSNPRLLRKVLPTC